MVHDPAASIVDHLVDADTQTVLVDKSLDRLPEFIQQKFRAWVVAVERDGMLIRTGLDFALGPSS